MKKIYLTRMMLNPRSNRVRSEVGRPQELHKTISNAFPEVKNPPDTPKHLQKTPRNEYNILYRLDIDPRGGKAVLLIQAEYEPNWNHLPADYAEISKPKDVGENYQAIENGMNLIFRLQANPTKRVANRYEYPNESKRDEFDHKFKNEKKRRRVPIHKEEEQIKWLERQGEQFGFKIENLKINPAVRNVISATEGKIEFWKNGKDTKVTYGSIVFEGVLQVTDSDKFRAALVNGIGQGKAYGFGLLSIAPERAASA